MKRRDKEGARGLVVGVATVGWFSVSWSAAPRRLAHLSQRTQARTRQPIRAFPPTQLGAGRKRSSELLYRSASGRSSTT